MGQERPPARRAGLVAALAKEDVTSDGKRLRAKRGRGRGRSGPGVQAHISKVLPDDRLERGALFARELLARLIQADERQKVLAGRARCFSAGRRSPGNPGERPSRSPTMYRGRPPP